MDENKKKKGEGQESGVETDDIQQEMEDLARIFKEELEKTKKETEDLLDIEDLEVEGYDPKKVSKAKNKTEEDEMCEYCGERPRGTEKNPKSPYCKNCEELLEKCPYDYKGVIVALAIVCIVIGAVFCFAVNTPIFSMMKKADRELNEGRLYSAVTDYEHAFELVQNKDTEDIFYNLHAKRINASYRLANWTYVKMIANEYMDEKVLKLPTFKETKEIVDDVEVMIATSVIIADYVNVDNVKENEYESAMKKLDDLVGKKVYIRDGKYYEEGDENLVRDGKEKEYTMDAGWIHLIKFQIAVNMEKPAEEYVGFLEDAVGQSEFMLSTAGFKLAATYVELKQYDKAEKVAKELYDINKESPDYYQIESMLKRYRDKDYKGAIAVADEGIEALKKSSAGEVLAIQYGCQLNMHKGLNYIMLGDYETANDVIYDCCYYLSQTPTDTGYLINIYPEAWEICALVALEIGDEETYKIMEENFKTEQAAEKDVYEANLAEYKAGTKTLANLVESGRFDLI